MKPLDLTNHEHPTFKFLRPTENRINGSVAWEVVCKRCGTHQLVGSSQVLRGTHASCINCQLSQELRNREVKA